MSDLATSSIDLAQRRGHYLHLRTQRNQPYGSVRRCCEICGVMIWEAVQGESTPMWTDNEAEYFGEAHRCELRPKESP